MRRTVALAVSLVIFGLIGCGNPPSLNTGEQDALLVDRSFIRIANLLAVTPGEPASVVAVAKSLTNGSTGPLDVVQTGLLALLANTQPPATVASLPAALSQLDLVLTQLEPIAASFNPEASAALMAAEILLTTAETIAGVPPSTAAVQRTARASQAGITPEAARRTLRAFLGQRSAS